MKKVTSAHHFFLKLSVKVMILFKFRKWPIQLSSSKPLLVMSSIAKHLSKPNVLSLFTLGVKILYTFLVVIDFVCADNQPVVHFGTVNVRSRV